MEEKSSPKKVKKVDLKSGQIKGSSCEYVRRKVGAQKNRNFKENESRSIVGR